MSKRRIKFMHTRHGCVFLPQLSESHLVVITSVDRISIEILMIRPFTWGVVLGSFQLIFKNGVGTHCTLPIGADMCVYAWLIVLWVARDLDAQEDTRLVCFRDAV